MQLLLFNFSTPAWKPGFVENAYFALFWIFIPGAFRKAFPNSRRSSNWGKGVFSRKTLETGPSTAFLVGACYIIDIGKGSEMASTTWDWDLGLNEGWSWKLKWTEWKKNNIRIRKSRLEEYCGKGWKVRRSQSLPQTKTTQRSQWDYTYTKCPVHLFIYQNAYIYLPSPPIDFLGHFQIIFLPQQEGPSPVC